MGGSGSSPEVSHAQWRLDGGVAVPRDAECLSSGLLGHGLHELTVTPQEGNVVVRCLTRRQVA